MSLETGNIKMLAPGKINLYLEVLGRRENGYHDIRSVVLPISLADVVCLEKTDGLVETSVFSGDGIVLEAEFVRRSAENLATKAALLLKQVAGYSGGVRIRIEKNIPLGGGLGGGSADAAAVLTGLDRLWGIQAGSDELAQIGSGLGCDIPAMIHGRAVLIEGLGEKVTPIRAGAKASWWLVLVNPGFPVSTGDIYARHSSSLTSDPPPCKSIVSSVENGTLDEAVFGLFNDLQATVFRKYPAIEIAAEALKKAGALGVLLSGSGATVFGLARDEAHAGAVASRVGGILGFPVWCKVARTLPDGVMVAHGPLEA